MQSQAKYFLRFQYIAGEINSAPLFHISHCDKASW